MDALYVARMRAARTAAERRAVVADMCRSLAISTAQAYKRLRAAGWDSGRAPRRDAGTRTVSDETIALVAAMLKACMRKNGKSTMSIPTARSILKDNGYAMPLADSRLRELLAIDGLSLREARVPSPHVRMRSLYPNHVHQVDPSVALMWFSPGGSQKLYDDDEVYKNKNPREGKLKCWRYVLTDHASGTICVRYYAAMGESSANLYDFLLYAWGPKSNPLYVFHGLPEILVWDAGSANTGRAVRTALAALRVKTIAHMPGAPRVKGQVESANRIVEAQFESRLRLEPVGSIEELNDAAERWAAAHAANMIEGLDTRITRKGTRIDTRLNLWRRITTEQLRELPDPEICRQIYTMGVQTRTVGGDLGISIVHPKTKQSMHYSLYGLPGVLVGQTVNVQPVLVSCEPTALVSYMHAGELVRYELRPIEYDVYGFGVTNPVWGESYRSAGSTEREHTATRLRALAGDGAARPFAQARDGQGLMAHSQIDARSAFVQAALGRPVEVERVTPQDILMSATEAAKRLKARLGYVPDGCIAGLRAQYPDGVPARCIDDMAIAYADDSAATTKIG